MGARNTGSLTLCVVCLCTSARRIVWQADASTPQLLTVSLAMPPQPTGRVALPTGAQQAVSAAYTGLATVMQPEPGFHLTLQIQLDALPVHDGTMLVPSVSCSGDRRAP